MREISLHLSKSLVFCLCLMALGNVHDCPDKLKVSR